MKRLYFLLISIIIALHVWAAGITDKKMATGFKTCTNRKIEVLIIHSVFNNSGGDKYDANLIIKQFSRYHVSAHFLIGRNGEIFRLVDEKNISYHAGKSMLPDGRRGVNSISIGIELMTSFDDPVTPGQMESLLQLTTELQKKYKFKYILRHSDIAPGRKTDPWNFDWEEYNRRLSTPR